MGLKRSALDLDEIRDFIVQEWGVSKWGIWQASKWGGHRSRTYIQQVGHNNPLKQRHGCKLVITSIYDEGVVIMGGHSNNKAVLTTGRHNNPFEIKTCLPFLQLAVQNNL